MILEIHICFIYMVFMVILTETLGKIGSIYCINLKKVILSTVELEMENHWKLFQFWSYGVFFVALFQMKLEVCWSLNPEGFALLKFHERVETDPYNMLLSWNGNADDPCTWFGVLCLDGNIVMLNLKGLHLKGLLAPELRDLIHLKYLILNNNHFYGNIPKELGELKELEIVDLGHNKLSGHLPSELGNILTLKCLFLHNNMLHGGLPSKIQELKMLTELLVDDNLLSDCAQGPRYRSKSSGSRNMAIAVDPVQRRLLQNSRNVLAPRTNDSSPKENENPPTESGISPPQRNPPLSAPSPSPAQSPSALHSPRGKFESSHNNSSSSSEHSTSGSTEADSPIRSPTSNPTATFVDSPHNSEKMSPRSDKTSFPRKIYISVLSVAAFLLIVSYILFVFCRNHGVVSIRPWRTGLSGQLQKEFLKGIPRLQFSDIESACEDFSNVIGSSMDNIVFKGTLNKVEIAVISTTVNSAKDWSENSEGCFRKKIVLYSRLNHKNLLNFLGYCEEEEPFVRMLVFEYASNGTLCENLHVKEEETLEWTSRRRIVMEVACCLKYLHELNPPLLHTNLDCNSFYLTDNQIPKLSLELVPRGTEASINIECMHLDFEENVYSFGLILLEMITSKHPYRPSGNGLAEWAIGVLKGDRPPLDLTDYDMNPEIVVAEVDGVCEVMRCCMDSDWSRRPTMKEVVNRLRSVINLTRDHLGSLRDHIRLVMNEGNED
ncbi:protein MALE DISCOVERER 2 isoform X1 [Amborella trichopoda]|nr:protein MALE DISCOVERER 2 isoform X1 [Amborella trichopoda]|eukprot:XP_020524671.1 protein MALE DISCOVERER 2 isoform X1 [Amborella trichopoda]